MDDPRAKQQINSILQLDLDTITFSDIHWRYGTFQPYSTGSGRDKKYFSRSGVATPIGDIQEDLWYQVAEHIAKREGEEWLVDALTQWDKEHNYMKESPSELRKDALQSYSHSLYDNPRWVDFIPFNRQFRPEVLETAGSSLSSPTAARSGRGDPGADRRGAEGRSMLSALRTLEHIQHPVGGVSPWDMF